MEYPIDQVAISRIIQISRYQLRQILKEAGGEQALGFDTYQELRLQVPDYRNGVLRQLAPLRSAVAHASIAKRITISSPNLRPLTFDVAPEDCDESLIDLDGTEEQRQFFEEAIRLEARCRLAMDKSRDLLVILNRHAWRIDCNYIERRIGIDRMDAIGKTTEESFPHLAGFIHDLLAEAFKYAEIPVYGEFTHEVLGFPCQFRIKLESYGEEALGIITPLSSYPWLF